MKINGKYAIIGVIAIIVLACIGWFSAGHYATKAARDVVDGYIIRHDLKGTVSYHDISASPFGKVTLYGVTVKMERIPVKCDKVLLSGIDTDHDVSKNVDVTFSGLDIPALAFARRGSEPARFFTGLGYTSLHGHIGFSYKLSEKGALAVKTNGEIDQAGSWNLDLDLAGIEAETLSALGQAFARVGKMSGSLESVKDFNEVIGIGMQLLKAIAEIKLARLEFAVDDSGVFERMEKLTDESVPSGRTPSGFRLEKILNETFLVKGGMGPSAAKEVTTKVNGWLQKGGKISLSTGLEHPIALLRPGRGLPEPAFDNFATFLVVTKAKIH